MMPFFLAQRVGPSEEKEQEQKNEANKQADFRFCVRNSGLSPNETRKKN